MPNDGNKIWAGTKNGVYYGVALDRDVCPVLGLPETTSINYAAACDKVNPDSLFKPIPVSTPPNLTTEGKTETQIKNELIAFMGANDYGYSIPKIGDPTTGSASKTLSASDFQGITSGSYWQRRPFGANDFRDTPLFDGYNHRIKYQDYGWGHLTVEAKRRWLNVKVNMTASPDLVYPGNMSRFANYKIALFVYSHQNYGGATGTPGYAPVWGGCWPNGLTSVEMTIGSDSDSSVIKKGTTYAVAAFLVDAAFDDHVVSNTTGTTWASRTFYSLFYGHPDFPSWATATTPNLTEWQEYEVGVTATVFYVTSAGSGQTKAFRYRIIIRCAEPGKSIRVRGWYRKNGDNNAQWTLFLSGGVQYVTPNTKVTSNGKEYYTATIDGEGGISGATSGATYSYRVQADLGKADSDVSGEYISVSDLISDSPPQE